MSDRVFPSSKPTANGTAAAAGPGKVASTANVNGTVAGNPAAGSNKSHLYNPTSRLPYRQPAHTRRRGGRSGRSICCCFCFWTILIIILILFMAAIVGAALYILYHPHRPEFSIPSLRVHRFNLTTSADASTSHLSTLLNMTIISRNPNSYLSFSYDPFTVSSFSSDVFLGNGSLPGLYSENKNQTSFKNVVVSGSSDLDVESVNALRSDLRKKRSSGGGGVVTLKIQLDTKVVVKMSKLKTKKVGIRVTCDGIKGVVPKGKLPTVAVTTNSKCNVDLRIKIWKWTF